MWLGCIITTQKSDINKFPLLKRNKNHKISVVLIGPKEGPESICKLELIEFKALWLYTIYFFSYKIPSYSTNHKLGEK